MNAKYLITFHTNFDALTFRQKAGKYGRVNLRPVPRKLSSSCGTCAEFTPADKAFDESFFDGLAFEKLCAIEGQDVYRLLKEND